METEFQQKTLEHYHSVATEVCQLDASRELIISLKGAHKPSNPHNLYISVYHSDKFVFKQIRTIVHVHLARFRNT